MFSQTVEQGVEAKIYEYVGTFLTLKSDLYNIKKMCIELLKKYPTDTELMSIKAKAEELEAKQDALNKTLSELTELLKRKQYIALLPKSFSFYIEADRQIYDVSELKKRLDQYIAKRPFIDLGTLTPYLIGAGVALLGISLIKRS
jgi:hypothetical protein